MDTLSQPDASAQVAVSEAATAFPTFGRINLPEMSDEQVVRFAEMADEYLQEIGDCKNAALRDLERRIRDRQKADPSARAIPDMVYEIELVDEYTPYRADVEKLREARPMLPEDEGAKLLVHRQGKIVVTFPGNMEHVSLLSEVAKRYGGHIEVIAPCDEPGNVTSILALAKKYAGTIVGNTLAAAITRTRTGDKLLFRRRKAAAKAVRA